MYKSCPEYQKLQREVQLILKEISELTTDLLEAFQASDRNRFVKLDKEFEEQVGRKERTVGALRQHVKDHKCAAPHRAA